MARALGDRVDTARSMYCDICGMMFQIELSGKKGCKVWNDLYAAAKQLEEEYGFESGDDEE